MNENRRTPIQIPQAGVAMTEGTIVEWLADDGERVLPGQPLYLLETEKVEMEVECPAAGVVHIVGRPGQIYPVGEEVGYIDGP
ncbi:MAG TPA: lipoyl domain-containing protein [Acidimicrobiales bacterium]|jgi:pyruvate/2-oxoglutarate dehydrogenase complex dihydrolipoamide acyltransferase (E2) component